MAKVHFLTKMMEAKASRDAISYWVYIKNLMGHTLTDWDWIKARVLCTMCEAHDDMEAIRGTLDILVKLLDIHIQLADSLVKKTLVSPSQVPCNTWFLCLWSFYALRIIFVVLFFYILCHRRVKLVQPIGMLWFLLVDKHSLDTYHLNGFFFTILNKSIVVIFNL